MSVCGSSSCRSSCPSSSCPSFPQHGHSVPARHQTASGSIQILREPVLLGAMVLKKTTMTNILLHNHMLLDNWHNGESKSRMMSAKPSVPTGCGYDESLCFGPLPPPPPSTAASLHHHQPKPLSSFIHRYNFAGGPVTTCMFNLDGAGSVCWWQSLLEHGAWPEAFKDWCNGQTLRGSNDQCCVVTEFLFRDCRRFLPANGGI